MLSLRLGTCLSFALVISGCWRGSGLATVAPVDLVGFPRHSEQLLVNDGNDYVYGDLFTKEGCLRITYSDPDGDYMPDGLLPVWPAGIGLDARGGTVVVVDDGGRVLAEEGGAVRLSGRLLGEWPEGSSFWEWVGNPDFTCLGPYWVVGDEVSSGDSLVTDPSQAGVYFPTIRNTRGVLSHQDALLSGRLVLQRRCLRIIEDGVLERFLVVWPPGFRLLEDGDSWVVTNGGGSVLARVGERLAVGGYSPEVTDYPGGPDCLGRYFYAYELMPDFWSDRQ